MTGLDDKVRDSKALVNSLFKIVGRRWANLCSFGILFVPEIKMRKTVKVAQILYRLLGEWHTEYIGRTDK